MHPLIISAVPVGKYVFCAKFNNGESRRYDVKPLIDEIPAFRELERVPSLFNQIRPEDFGHAVVWNEHLDLAAEEIYENGVIS